MMLLSLWFAGSVLCGAFWALAGWVLVEREPSSASLSERAPAGLAPAHTDLAPAIGAGAQGSAA